MGLGGIEQGVYILLLPDKDAFRLHYRRCFMAVSALCFVSVTVLFLLGEESPESMTGWLWHVTGALAMGCVAAQLGWYTIGPRLRFTVLGKRTLAIYLPLLKSRTFVRREECVSYRPVAHSVVTRDGRVHRVSFGGLPFAPAQSVANAGVLDAWWPDLAEEAAAVARRSRHGLTRLILPGLSAISLFIVATLWLFVNAAFGTTALICCLAVVVAAWVLCRDYRQRLQIALPASAVSFTTQSEQEQV